MENLWDHRDLRFRGAVAERPLRANDTMYMAFQTPTYPFDPTTGLELPAGLYF
jgi:hypothetical protein